MSFDDVVGALIDHLDVAEACDAATAGWGEYRGPFLRMLHEYCSDADRSERTEQVLYAAVPLLAQHREEACFGDLCTLGCNPDKLISALGEDGALLTFPGALVSTYGGDIRPLQQLIEDDAADELARVDAVRVMEYLASIGRIPEKTVYGYLSQLPSIVRQGGESPLWEGYALAVAALGFSGLSGVVDSLISRDLVPVEAMLTSTDFWRDLRYTQQNGRDLSDDRWVRFEPIENAGQHLLMVEASVVAAGELAAGAFPDLVDEPIRNPLRHVGRNDPCPCGSGKKYKKCCLQAGAA